MLRIKNNLNSCIPLLTTLSLTHSLFRFLSPLPPSLLSIPPPLLSLLSPLHSPLFLSLPAPPPPSRPPSLSPSSSPPPPPPPSSLPPPPPPSPLSLSLFSPPLARQPV